jgi:hypothetical protein
MFVSNIGMMIDCTTVFHLKREQYEGIPKGEHERKLKIHCCLWNVTDLQHSYFSM